MGSLRFKIVLTTEGYMQNNLGKFPGNAQPYGLKRSKQLGDLLLMRDTHINIYTAAATKRGW